MKYLKTSSHLILRQLRKDMRPSPRARSNSHPVFCSNIDSMIALIELHTVVGFFQGCELWVIHPSAKIIPMWQATHYNTQSMSMINDCLRENIESVLYSTELNFDEPVMVMDPAELDWNLANATSDFYCAG